MVILQKLSPDWCLPSSIPSSSSDLTSPSDRVASVSLLSFTASSLLDCENRLTSGIIRPVHVGSRASRIPSTTFSDSDSDDLN